MNHLCIDPPPPSTHTPPRCSATIELPRPAAWTPARSSCCVLPVAEHVAAAHRRHRRGPRLRHLLPRARARRRRYPGPSCRSPWPWTAPCPARLGDVREDVAAPEVALELRRLTCFPGTNALGLSRTRRDPGAGRSWRALSAREEAEGPSLKMSLPMISGASPGTVFATGLG